MSHREPDHKGYLAEMSEFLGKRPKGAVWSEADRDYYNAIWEKYYGQTPTLKGKTPTKETPVKKATNDTSGGNSNEEGR